MVEENPLAAKPGYWSQLLFIIASSAVLLYGIVFLNKNFFFVIYIFWFEALLHVIFNYFRIRKAGKDITELPERNITINKRELTLADYNNRPYFARVYAGTNLFLLFTYFVFIIVMVGFVIPLSIHNHEMFVQNIRIMLFLDKTFLLSLVVFFTKSISDYRNNYILNDAYKETNVLKFGSFFDRQNLVMHISLIVGIGCWFMINRYLPAYSVYTMTTMATAFVVIKLGADLYSFTISQKV